MNGIKVDNKKLSWKVTFSYLCTDALQTRLTEDEALGTFYQK